MMSSVVSTQYTDGLRTDTARQHTALSPVSIQTQSLALANSQSWLPTQALAFLAVFVCNATHATQTIAFEWKPGLTHAGHSIA